MRRPLAVFCLCMCVLCMYVVYVCVSMCVHVYRMVYSSSCMRAITCGGQQWATGVFFSLYFILGDRLIEARAHLSVRVPTQQVLGIHLSLHLCPLWSHSHTPLWPASSWGAEVLNTSPLLTRPAIYPLRYLLGPWHLPFLVEKRKFYFRLSSIQY